MKTILIFITPLFLLSVGCSSSKNTGSKGNIQIVNAQFEHWSEPPSGNSDVPERGTDLSITIKNWSSDFTPEYIIYDSHKSLSAAITDTVDGHLLITGRIVRSSSKLAETSETVNESNGLVYKDSNEDQQHIEIADWESSKQ